MPATVPTPTRSHVVRATALTAALALTALACSSDPDDAAPTVPPTTAGEATTTTAAPDTSTTIDLTPREPVTYDIVGTALNAVVFSQLAGMVVDAGLVETLRSPGPFTVFAPTDDAFAKLPLEALHGVQDDPDLLATVLTYHVVPGALTLADLQDGALTTVAGIDLEISHRGDTVLVNGNPIAAGDIVATNGVIHVMGDVLLPPG